MQYRTYAIKKLVEHWSYEFKHTGVINYDRNFFVYDTLVYASGGAVTSYDIDSDYMVSNNSTISITTKSESVVGQIITLIKDDGTYETGVVTSVDNEKLEIQFKSLLSAFDVNMLNNAFLNYKYDAVGTTAYLLGRWYASQAADAYLRIPLKVRTSGSVKAIWDYEGDTINLRDWFIDLFNRYNIIIRFDLIFEVGGNAYIDMLISSNATSEVKVIKNNIQGLKVEQETVSASKYTVCAVLDSSTKALIKTYYLLSDKTITDRSTHDNRLYPYKLTTATLDVSNTEGVTAYDVAASALIDNGLASHYIKLTIDKNSKMYPKGLYIGDRVKLVPKLKNMTLQDSIPQDYSNDKYDTCFTGKKESSNNSSVTLIFGKIRVNYTDIIQMNDLKKIRA